MASPSAIKVTTLRRRVIAKPVLWRRSGGRSVRFLVPAAEDTAEDGKHNEDKVERVPPALYGRRTKATKGGRQEGREEEKYKDGEQNK